MRRELYEEVRKKALELYSKVNIVLTKEEQDNLEVADFGLDDIYHIGLEVVTYVNSDRCCAKELVLLPEQTCPEHKHPPIGEYIGKEETFRVRYGIVYLYVDDNIIFGQSDNNTIDHNKPENGKEYYTANSEIVLHPGEQYTLTPNTKHWFRAGKEGAVVSEFSTTSYDEHDIFTDPRIKRIPIID